MDHKKKDEHSRDPRALVRTMRALAKERGDKAETFVVAACNAMAAAGQPKWLKPRSRISSESQDRAGIDVLVATDVGLISLQVKSSFTGARLFAEYGRARGLKPIPIVVVPHDFNEQLLRSKIVSAVGSERARIKLALPKHATRKHPVAQSPSSSPSGEASVPATRREAELARYACAAKHEPRRDCDWCARIVKVMRLHAAESEAMREAARGEAAE